jgi:hypothetical protein
MKYLVILFFLAILGSLGGALFYMMRAGSAKSGRPNRMATALAVRIGLSVCLFLFLLLAHFLGWIQPTGIPVGQ